MIIKRFYYTRKDEQTLRADKIYKHTAGNDPSEDELVYHEEDETLGHMFTNKNLKNIWLLGATAR